MSPNSGGRPPGRWRDRAKEYMCEGGATRGGGLDQARRERWRLFCHNHPLGIGRININITATSLLPFPLLFLERKVWESSMNHYSITFLFILLLILPFLSSELLVPSGRWPRTHGWQHTKVMSPLYPLPILWPDSPNPSCAPTTGEQGGYLYIFTYCITGLNVQPWCVFLMWLKHVCIFTEHRSIFCCFTDIRTFLYHWLQKTVEEYHLGDGATK